MTDNADISISENVKMSDNESSSSSDDDDQLDDDGNDIQIKKIVMSVSGSLLIRRSFAGPVSPTGGVAYERRMAATLKA